MAFISRTSAASTRNDKFTKDCVLDSHSTATPGSPSWTWSCQASPLLWPRDDDSEHCFSPAKAVQPSVQHCDSDCVVDYNVQARDDVATSTLAARRGLQMKSLTLQTGTVQLTSRTLQMHTQLLCSKAGAPAEPSMAAPAPAEPGTPQKSARVECFTPPPMLRMPRKSKFSPPALLQALEANSLKEVHNILQESPEAKDEPFWDHGGELPICAATRLGCNASIMELLGASRTALDNAQDLAAEVDSLFNGQGHTYPAPFLWEHEAFRRQVSGFEAWCKGSPALNLKGFEFDVKLST